MNNNYYGHLGESIFCVEAQKQGFSISKPINNESKYDFILDFKGKLSRIQVKSSTRKFANGNCTVLLQCGNSSKKKYDKSMIDYFAIWLVGRDSWYIIPVEDVLGGNITVGKRSKWDAYMNAWDLLK